ncbi:MAG TPA: cell division topological specificity factor MinE [Syntrophomonadaceae bacterium]|nr:cell division topological specificity factor MinE [Syntrophomonadaceae bacterium]HNX28257.1 cell division topological specificity factor MinE [Syntrophomonadaceae bacterium]HPR92464.1 cell division topological specificity factor MinE [Syntrophomonadaceae bacterium]
MLDILYKIFSRDNNSSKNIARERLRLVLIHDRATISPDVLLLLKEDLIKVIREYLEIDEEALLVNLENDKESVALVANIPVKGLRRAVNT